MYGFGLLIKETKIKIKKAKLKKKTPQFALAALVN